MLELMRLVRESTRGWCEGCVRVIGLGRSLSSELPCLARPHEKKLELARRALEAINCQSFLCLLQA